MDPYANIALCPDVRFGRMKADADHWSGSRQPAQSNKGALCSDGGKDGILDPVEGDEECVPLCIDLPAPVLTERRPKEPTVLVEQVGVTLA
jgi:hypothetical protein